MKTWTRKEAIIWANKQRSKYANGTLSPHKVTSLEEIDGWSWEMDLEKN